MCATRSEADTAPPKMPGDAANRRGEGWPDSSSFMREVGLVVAMATLVVAEVAVQASSSIMVVMVILQ